MTAQEITDLRRKLEGSLLRAFTDFRTATGVSIESVEVVRVCNQTVGDRYPQHVVAAVRIKTDGL